MDTFSAEWAAAHAEALAIVEDHHGVNPERDRELMRRLFARLGWAMLTLDAVEMLAGFYEAEAELVDRINAENRAIRERNEAEAALTRRAQERGEAIGARLDSSDPSQVAA